jgi:peptidyl-prolyl cis-trans isomerase C
MHHAIERKVLPLFIIAALLWGCDQGTEEPSAASETPSDVVATVNKEPLTQQDLNTYIATRRASQPDVPLEEDEALNQLVRLELIKQQAEKEDVDEREDIQAQLEWQRTNLLVDTFMKKRIAEMRFTDEELRDEYQAQLAKLSNREYKARHILLKTRAEAVEIIKQLEDGASFKQMAEDSAAPTAIEGGDLGWFSPEQMVPPFAQAVQKLKVGAYSKAPVKTQYGWHVILLEDIRELDPPAYEEVKERVEAILTDRAIQSYIAQLREQAQVDIKLSPRTQQAASKSQAKP